MRCRAVDKAIPTKSNLSYTDSRIQHTAVDHVQIWSPLFVTLAFERARLEQLSDF